jgi:23S rRNA (uridine2552-2'-O)-methyltransferase
MAGSYNRKDHLHQKAKEEGFRSRASYKLQELQKKYSVIKNGNKVLDLGCWPGGWLQVASKLVGPHGLVVGIDLVETEPLYLNNVVTITGDARDEEIREEAIAAAEGPFDVIVSDMSPKISGIPEVDRTATVGLNELTLWMATQIGRPGSTVIMKVFKGNETEEFFRKEMRPSFEKVVRTELDATRKTSSEFYLVGFGLKIRDSV